MEKSTAENRKYLADRGDTFAANIYRGVSIMRYTHIHSVYELYFCPEDIAQRSVICGTEYVHNYPSVILCKPHTIHSMSCLPDCPTDYRRYTFTFDEKSVSKFGIDLFPNEIFRQKLGLLFKLTPNDAAYLESIVQFYFNPEYPLEESEQISLFSFFLHKLYSFTKNGNIVGIGNASYGVQKVMEYICEHFTENITSAKLAAQFSVSRSKLDRDFINAIGETPQAFIEHCRLDYAKRILTVERKIKISTLSELCGFSSENYFYRFFKKHTGKTPTEYKKHKNEFDG